MTLLLWCYPRKSSFLQDLIYTVTVDKLKQNVLWEEVCCHGLCPLVSSEEVVLNNHLYFIMKNFHVDVHGLFNDAYGDDNAHAPFTGNKGLMNSFLSMTLM